MVKTRFAPSPTGALHLGGVRTALYNWLYARHCQGSFVLRIEDTDVERSTEASVRVILEGLQWLNLSPDEGPYYQTERRGRYLEVVDYLLQEGLAYRCFCDKERINQLRETQLQRKEKPRYDLRCRELNLPYREAPHVIRFKNPLTGRVTFKDQVLGELQFDNRELDDMVLVRSDGMPTYNFCVVVDDLDMQITHVIRGADHVNNTPRQINLYRALGVEPPIYAHIPMILGNDGKLLSKRHGASSVLEYQKLGILPEALINYLLRLGWAHGDQEIFTIAEMVELFELTKIHKGAAAFDWDKLLWLNAHYLKNLSMARIVQGLEPFMRGLPCKINQGPPLEEVVAVLRERSRTLKELAENSSCFYREEIEYGSEAAKILTSEQEEILRQVVVILQSVEWEEGAIHAGLKQLAKQLELKLGAVAQPVRVAVTGSLVSPPINVTLKLLGRERALRRLIQALNFIRDSRDDE